MDKHKCCYWCKCYNRCDKEEKKHNFLSYSCEDFSWCAYIKSQKIKNKKD